MPKEQQPTIGLALSGAAARSMYYVGFLEVLQEEGIRIDAIAAQSGATIVAASFACGTMEQLKEEAFALDRKSALGLLERGRNGGGLYSLEPFENLMREKYTHGASLEGVHPKLSFVAADLDQGEIVVLSMGDIARASRISCTVPGLFEPVKWGNRTLVDGGLLSYIPGDIVRKAGTDIVIGVSVRATRHIFMRNQIMLRHWYNRMKRALFSKPKSLIWDNAGKIIKTEQFTNYITDLGLLDQDQTENPGLFSVLGRSLDLAVEASQKTNATTDPLFGCDILIRQGAGKFGESAKLSKMQELYQDGRKAAIVHLPKIKARIQSGQ